MTCSQHVRDRGSRFGQLGVRHGSFDPGSVTLRHACFPAPGYGIADHGHVTGWSWTKLFAAMVTGGQWSWRGPRLDQGGSRSYPVIVITKSP